MGTEANKAIVRRFIDEVFNEGKLAALAEVVDRGYIMHGTTPEVRGQQGMQEFVTTYRTALPDYHCTIEDQVAEGDKVVTRWTVRGTQRGELDGIPPTGKPVTLAGIVIDRIASIGIGRSEKCNSSRNRFSTRACTIQCRRPHLGTPHDSHLEAAPDCPNA